MCFSRFFGDQIIQQECHFLMASCHFVLIERLGEAVRKLKGEFEGQEVKRAPQTDRNTWKRAKANKSYTRTWSIYGPTFGEFRV